MILSSDDKYIIIGEQSKSIQVWEIPDAKKRSAPLEHHSCICNLALARNNKFIVSKCEDRTINIWNFKDLTQVSVLKNHTAEILWILASNDMKYSYLHPKTRPC